MLTTATSTDGQPTSTSIRPQALPLREVPTAKPGAGEEFDIRFMGHALPVTTVSCEQQGDTFVFTVIANPAAMSDHRLGSFTPSTTFYLVIWYKRVRGSDFGRAALVLPPSAADATLDFAEITSIAGAPSGA